MIRADSGAFAVQFAVFFAFFVNYAHISAFLDLDLPHEMSADYISRGEHGFGFATKARRNNQFFDGINNDEHDQKLITQYPIINRKSSMN